MFWEKIKRDSSAVQSSVAVARGCHLSFVTKMLPCCHIKSQVLLAW